jgi:hypothetical protein
MERQIELYKDEPGWKHTVRIWEGRIPHFQAVLKERADNGTY